MNSETEIWSGILPGEGQDTSEGGGESRRRLPGRGRPAAHERPLRAARHPPPGFGAAAIPAAAGGKLWRARKEAAAALISDLRGPSNSERRARLGVFWRPASSAHARPRGETRRALRGDREGGAQGRASRGWPALLAHTL